MKPKKTEDGRRVARFEKEIHSTIAQFLIRGLKVRLPGLVTVSFVRMPADLKSAKVYVSVIGETTDAEKAVEILQSQAFSIQKYIGQELKIRYCPRLTFFVDDRTDAVLKIEKILDDLKKTSSKVD